MSKRKTNRRWRKRRKGVVTIKDKLWQAYLPPNSVAFCEQFVERHNITVTVKTLYATRGRASGDEISMRHDLNPQEFMLTFLHEVAHVIVNQEKYGKNDLFNIKKALEQPFAKSLIEEGLAKDDYSSHGRIWKGVYIWILMQVVNSKIVTEEHVIEAILKYVEQPTRYSPRLTFGVGW